MNLKYKEHEQNCIHDDRIAKPSDDKETILNSSCRKHRFVTDRERIETERTIFLVEQDEQEGRRATSLKNTIKDVNLKFYT